MTMKTTCGGDALNPFYILDTCSETPVAEFVNSAPSTIPYHLLPLYVWFKNPFVARWLPCVKCGSNGTVYIDNKAAWIERAGDLAVDLSYDLSVVRNIIVKVVEESLQQLETEDAKGHRGFFENWYTSSMALMDELEALISRG